MSDTEIREMTPAELELIEGGNKEKAETQTKGAGPAAVVAVHGSPVEALYDVFRLRF
jgi:hypothetical protein